MGERRDRGSGSIYRMANGKYRGQFDCGIVDGKRKRKSFTGDKESEVKAKLKAYEREYALLRPDNRGDVSFKEYADHWLEIVKKPSLKVQSYARLKSTLDLHVYPYIGDMKLSKIKSDDLQILLNHESEKENSHSLSSIVKIQKACSQVLQYAEDNGDIIRNPAKTVQIPVCAKLQEKKMPRVFSAEEQCRISDEATKKFKNGSYVFPYGWAFVLILNTGMRIGEALALGLDRVCTAGSPSIIIDRIVVKDIDANGKSIYRIQPAAKTASSVREIPANKEAVRAIYELALQNTNKESNLLISSRDGKIVAPYNFDRTFARILENCGIERCGVHSLRHTFATNLFDRHTDLTTVSRLLGHSSTKITADTYIHPGTETLRRAVDSLPGSVSKSTAERKNPFVVAPISAAPFAGASQAEVEEVVREVCAEYGIESAADLFKLSETDDAALPVDEIETDIFGRVDEIETDVFENDDDT